MMYSVRLLVITTAILSISWLSWFNKIPGSYEAINHKGYILNISGNETFSMHYNGRKIFHGTWNENDKNAVTIHFFKPKDGAYTTMDGFIESDGDITFNNFSIPKDISNAFMGRNFSYGLDASPAPSLKIPRPCTGILT